MMNTPANSSSSSSLDPYVVPSVMSFAGLDANMTQKHPLWDWEPTAVAAAIPTQSSFFPGAAFINCPPPPLLPASNFPYYSPAPAPDYPLGGLFKCEADSLGVVGMGSAGDSSRIGLNLGHRTYFSSADAFAIDRLFARSRGGLYALGHYHQPPRCQAEGCKADLSGAKHYHRRHKVCEFHSKASVVVAAGLQQRFCQQCSRFHVLSEFDESKRSCRKRLADHNRRRRKAQLPSASSKDPAASSKNPTTNSNDKSKQTPKPTKDTSMTATTKSTTTGSNASHVSLEGQQAYQSKATQFRNGPALSLGGSAGTLERADFGPGALYRSNGSIFAPIVEEEAASVSQQQLFFSSTSHHHMNIFCSSSTEGSHSNGRGVSEQPTTNPTMITSTAINNCSSGSSGSSLLHLGQAMFEVDFM